MALAIVVVVVVVVSVVLVVLVVVWRAPAPGRSLTAGEASNNPISPIKII